MGREAGIGLPQQLRPLGRSPDTATAEDLRRFQLHQTQTGMQPPSVNSAVSALRFFFTVTLDRADLARRLTIVHRPRRLPAVLSAEEVALLLQAAPGRSTRRRSRPPPEPCPGAGRGRRATRVSEVVALKVGDADSERMLLRVERGKGRKDRLAMLSPQLLDCCAPGGGKDGAAACCCRAAGCFRGTTRSSRCRPASSTVPSTLPPRLPGSTDIRVIL